MFVSSFQNVIKISVFHIPANARNAHSPKELFHISKAPERVLRPLTLATKLSEPAKKLPNVSAALNKSTL